LLSIDGTSVPLKDADNVAAVLNQAPPRRRRLEPLTASPSRSFHSPDAACPSLSTYRCVTAADRWPSTFRAVPKSILLSIRSPLSATFSIH